MLLFRNRIPAYGLTIDTCLVTNRTRALLFWGFYESAEARYVGQYLNVNRPVIELGSSLGVISCLIRQRLNPEQRLICVEPNPEMISAIQSNLEINQLSHNVVIAQSAVDYSQSEVAMVLGSSNTTPRIATDQDGDIQVATTTLQYLLDEHQITGDYTLICDIEGAEVDLIFRDKTALQSCQQIIIELHSTTYAGKTTTPQDLINQLFESGFKLVTNCGSVCVFEK